MALSHAPQIVSDGLIIYLDANNTSSYAGTGSTWYDLSGNSRHASLISSPSYEGFGRGKYLSFDGSTNYATIPYTITDNLITVSFWYYSKIFSANSSLDALISNFTFGISGFDVRLNSSTTINLAIVIDGSQSLVNIGTISNNTWYHIAFTYDGATIKTYLDAVFKSSTNVIGTRANGTQICIGTSAFDTNRRATCGVPQVMIYNRALSDTEILQNYNATKGRYIVNENIVRDGLVVNLDAGSAASYPGTGITVTNIGSVSAQGATLLNGVSYGNANKGYFITDGSNDTIQGPNLSNIMLGSTSATMQVWFFPSALPSTYNAVIDVPGRSMSLWIGPTFSGQFYGWGGTASNSYNTNFSWQSSTWQMVTMVTSSTSSSIVNLIKNNFEITQSLAAFGTNFTGVIELGGNPSGGGVNFNGRYGIVLIYNRSLTNTEITQNYNALKNRYGLT
jgi:hypothetical protein